MFIWLLPLLVYCRVHATARPDWVWVSHIWLFCVCWLKTSMHFYAHIFAFIIDSSLINAKTDSEKVTVSSHNPTICCWRFSDLILDSSLLQEYLPKRTSSAPPGDVNDIITKRAAPVFQPTKTHTTLVTLLFVVLLWVTLIKTTLYVCRHLRKERQSIEGNKVFPTDR